VVKAPVSDSAAHDAAGEAVAIATGLPAPRSRRARQAFEAASDARARLRGLPDTAKRAHAVTRARAWADILAHMDATGEPEFCGCPHEPAPPAAVRAALTAWDWLARSLWFLNLAAMIQACRDALGADLVTFYQ
jgi:hypothetical protein